MIGILFWLCVISVLYTYAGYPLLLTLLARLRPEPTRPAPITPSLTLLIAAYDEQAVIAGKLDNSLALDYPRDRLQILVTADGSHDATADIVRGYAHHGVELSYAPVRRGKMAAINRAMPRARGDIVVFSDANNHYSPDALRELVAPFADARVGAVSGAKSIVQGDSALGDSEGLYWKYESFIKQQETQLGSCAGVAGEILAIRRDLYESPPDSVINDDFFMAMRLIQRGWRVVYAPAAHSIERVSPSAQDEVTRRARIVAGRYQAIALAGSLLPLRQPLIIWQIVSHKFLRPLVPFALAGALLTNLIAVARPRPAASQPLLHLTPPYNWAMLLLQAAFYGLAGVGTLIGHTGKLGTLLYLPSFLVNSNLAAVIGLYRFATRRQSVTWQKARRE